MNNKLQNCLAELEKNISPPTEKSLEKSWMDFCELCGKKPFSPARKEKNTPSEKYMKNDININKTLKNQESMAIQQFSECLKMLQNNSGKLLSVRCNYGTAIMPSIFGAELFIMDEQHNTLPGSKALNSTDQIKMLLDRGVPDINKSLGGKVFDMSSLYHDLLEKYPKAKRFIHIYHPDIQGPMDICEQLWGSSLFLDIIDKSDLVKDFLKLITETYIQFMKKWLKYNPVKKYSVQWGFMHKGKVMIRDDSAMNFSPEMFEEFIKPYDQKILNEFEGGAIHFCGRGSHYIESMCKMDNLFAINMSQPEYNELETVYDNTIDKGLKILDLEKSYAEKVEKNNRANIQNIHVRE